MFFEADYWGVESVELFLKAPTEGSVERYCAAPYQVTFTGTEAGKKRLQCGGAKVQQMNKDIYKVGCFHG